MSESAISVRKPLIKTIVFVIVTSFVLWLVSMQLGGPGLGRDDSYAADFTDASGLKSNDPVLMSGVDVGKVSGVENLDNGLARVEFTVRDGRRIPASAGAAARYRNLTGDRYLELTPGPEADAGSGDARMLPAEATISTSRTRPALDLDALLGGFNPLFEGLDAGQVNELSSNLVSVLQGQGGNIESILQRIASFTSSMADRDAVIGRVVGNLNSVLGNLDRNREQLGTTVDGLQRLVSGLSGDRGRLGRSFDQAGQLVGSVDGLVSRLRGPFQGFVSELGRTAAQTNASKDTLNDVLRTMPGAYLRVGRVASRGPGYNLYICSLRVRLTGPDGKAIYTPWIGPGTNVDRCKPGTAPLETPEQRESNERAGKPVGSR